MANYTQKAIISNFEKMLCEMPFDKITVTALVEKCEISSNTFYYHYRDIYDLLDDWIRIRFSKYPSEDYTKENWIDTVKQILHDMQENKKMVMHVYHTVSRERLERFLFETVEKDVLYLIQLRTKSKPISEETQQLLAGMCCYAMTGFFMKYIWTGMHADLDDYVDRLGDMLETCLSLYIEKM